jgi:hypothetical protein
MTRDRVFLAEMSSALNTGAEALTKSLWTLLRPSASTNESIEKMGENAKGNHQARVRLKEAGQSSIMVKTNRTDTHHPS